MYVCVYIYIYIYILPRNILSNIIVLPRNIYLQAQGAGLEAIEQVMAWGNEEAQDSSGVQWKQGVVIYMVLYTISLYYTTPIHCTPLRLHPPLQSIQKVRRIPLLR